jgi:hypothetical protein
LSPARLSAQVWAQFDPDAQVRAPTAIPDAQVRAPTAIPDAHVRAPTRGFNARSGHSIRYWRPRGPRYPRQAPEV